MNPRVEESQFDQIEMFIEFEQEEDTKEFINPYSFSKHHECLNTPGIIYLSIIVGEQVIGFFILALQGKRVEFRRVVITNSFRGVGQKAIEAMEAYCAECLQFDTIWLDVFAHNHRARHIYGKLGYVVVEVTEHEGKKLYIMEKSFK